MSRFTGRQFPGAARKLRADRRKAAARQQRDVEVRLAADVRSCPGKTRFASEALAEARARSINVMTGDEMRWYVCTACGWAHLGHPPGAATGIRHGEGRRESAADQLKHT